MADLLGIYLRDHEAGGAAGLDLFRRAVRNQGSRSYGPVLRELLAEVEADLTALRDLMREHGVSRSPLRETALRIGERLGRLKLNGGLIHRSPLSDLVEVEGLLDAVRAKEAGWRAAAEAPGADGWTRVDPSHFARRAAGQSERLLSVHADVAARAFAEGS